MPIEKQCRQCAGVFHVKPKDASRKFCSKRCMTAFEAVHGRIAARVALTEFACKECNKPFFYKPSIVTAYRKKWGKDPQYCSTKCGGIGRAKLNQATHTFCCVACGKENTKRRKPGGRLYVQQQYCDNACKSEHQRTRALERFNRGDYGRHIKRNGYVWISVPSLVTGKKHEMLEHRYVMSQSLGRELYPEETVHHKNGDRQHNTPDNLELFSSRHGPGQRVIDKIAFAIEMLQLYPEFGRAAGYELRAIEHVIGEPPLELRQSSG